MYHVGGIQRHVNSKLSQTSPRDEKTNFVCLWSELEQKNTDHTSTTVTAKEKADEPKPKQKVIWKKVGNY